MHLSLRLPGLPTCGFCGADDADLVVAGDHGFICECCIRDLVAGPPGPGAACALCRRPLAGSAAWRLDSEGARVTAMACPACAREARGLLAGRR